MGHTYSEQKPPNKSKPTLTAKRNCNTKEAAPQDKKKDTSIEHNYTDTLKQSHEEYANSEWNGTAIQTVKQLST
jgi:hypothetical protein